MSIAIIYLIAILIACRLRVLKFQYRHSNNEKKVKILNNIILAFILILFSLISFLITDSNLGFIKITITLYLYIIIFKCSNGNQKIQNDIILIVLMPLWVIIFSDTVNYSLVDMNRIVFPILIISSILFYGENELKVKRIMSFILAIGICCFLLYVPNGFIDIGERSEIDQISYDFLQDTFGLGDWQLHSGNGLRGEVITIEANRHNSKEYIQLYYSDGAIRNYSILK